MQKTLKSRSEWLEARKTGLGASDAAAILGVSPWKGALQLYHEKLGTTEPSKGESFARELGLALERPIAKLYAQRTKRLVILPPEGEFILERHGKKPFMVATLDGRQLFGADDENVDARNEPGVLEIKTAAISKAAMWTNEAPIDYQVQVQHQMAVVGVRYATCVALIGGVQLVHSDITRDNEFIAMLEAAEEEFWRRLELRDPPPPDGTEATKEFLKRFYPQVKPTSATLPPEALDWDAARMKAAADIKEAQGRKTAADNLLLHAIGEATIGILSNGVVYTRKTVNRTGYTVEPTAYVDFRRKGTAAEKTPKLKKGQAPSIEDVARVFDQQQAAEEEVRGGEDIQFD